MSIFENPKDFLEKTPFLPPSYEKGKNPKKNNF